MITQSIKRDVSIIGLGEVFSKIFIFIYLVVPYEDVFLFMYTHKFHQCLTVYMNAFLKPKYLCSAVKGNLK